MGRINLSALRVRQRALANLDTKRTDFRPVWPIHHTPPTLRSKTLPDHRTKVTMTLGKPQTTSKLTKASRMYSPTAIQYDEDALRKQFFSDHPWELARPRVVLETNGDQYAHADWSTGLKQPGIPLSGECVVQRQLWLLQNIPGIKIEESYDIARKEFYALRRRETTARRIAVEEAQMMGAVFGPSEISRGMTIESKMYDDWERWAEQMNMENDARMASFSGQQASVERKALLETREVEGGPSGPGALAQRQPRRPTPTSSSRIGAAIGNDVFLREERRRSAMGR